MTLARNIAFWPRVMTVVMNRDAYGRLSAAQRRALVGAGSAATGPAVQRIERVEGAAMRRLCRVEAVSPGGEPPDRHPHRPASDAPCPAAGLRRADARSATAAGIREIRAIRLATWPASAGHCPGDRPRPPGAHRQELRGRADAHRPPALVRAHHRAGSRHRTDRHPGGRVLFRSFTTGAGMIFRARFPRGRLFACVPLRSLPARRGYRWTGVGAIESAASPRLRRYTGLTLRLDGFTAAGDLTKLKAT